MIAVLFVQFTVVGNTAIGYAPIPSRNLAIFLRRVSGLGVVDIRSHLVKVPLIVD